MALARFPDWTVTDEFGNVVENVNVEVRREDSLPALAVIKSDRAGGTALANPFVAADGIVGFHALGGAYYVRAYKTIDGDLFERIKRYYPIGTAAETDTELGLSGGMLLTFDDGITDADPGAGLIRFNHATPASVTFLYVDLADIYGADITAWLESLDDSGSPTEKGRIRFQVAGNPAAWFIFKITGAVVTASDYRKIPVTLVASSGSTLTDGDTLSAFDVLSGPGSAADIAYGGGAGLSATTVEAAIDELATEKADLIYVDALIAAQDAMVFKGVIDCSANPNYPAADRGHTYRVSVAGKIGGGSGPNVEVADILICLTDSTAAGNHATIGASWSIIQANLDGAVLSTREIATTHSLTGGGDLSVNRTLSLIGDEASPGINQVYGTDAGGNKGWKADPAGGGGSSSDYSTRANVEAATIDPGVTAIRTLGYHVAGRGGADHVRLEFSADAAAVIAALPSTPPLAAQWAINNAIRRLDAAGVWAKLDILCDFGGVGIADIDAALVNWKNPAVPLTSNGTLTFTANLGITGDGTTGYIGTGLGLDDLSEWSLNSAHAGVWLTVNAAGYGFLNDDPVMGVTGRLYIRPNDSGKIQSVVNQSSNVRDGDVVGRLGHTVVNRSAAGAVEHYRDAEWVGSGTQASVDVSTSEIHFLRYNTDYAEDTIGWAHMGSSLTAAEVALIYEVMTEYRHIVLYAADPGALLISDDGAMWELAPNAMGRNVLQYGAVGDNTADDTQAFVDGTALRQKLHLPFPLWAYKIADEIAVRAHVTGEWPPIELTITTLNKRGFWLQDKSKLKGVDIRRTLDNATSVHGDRHNAICIGQFHGDQRPYYDIEVEARVTDAGATRHNIVTVIGNVKGLDIALDVNGDDMESVFLSHWGSVQNPSSVVQTIQRPRECRLRRLIARNEEVPGTYGMYLAGPVGWSIGQVELESFSRPVLISAGDLNQTYDAASNNETVGRLLSNNEIESLKIIDPVLDAIWCQGASDDEGGTRFFGTDRAAATSLHIGSLTIIRGANTTDGIARFDHWKNVTIDKFSILDEPGAASGVTDLVDPGLRIEACINMKITGRARIRHPVYIVSGCDIDLDLITENNRRTDSSVNAIGIRMNGAVPTATVDGAVSAGATSIVLDSAPCHIYPGMAFEISSVRHYFNGSAYSGDTTVTIPIEAAPASIADNAVITILNGPSDVELRGAMRGHYIGLETVSADKRVPFAVRSYMDFKEMYFHGAEINEGERIDFLSGTFDHNNRGNSATGRDIRIDATGVGYKVQNCDFCPSPSSALVHYHITTATGASAVDVSHNRYFTAPQTARTVLQANGADGVANQNSNNYTKP